MFSGFPLHQQLIELSPELCHKNSYSARIKTDEIISLWRTIVNMQLLENSKYALLQLFRILQHELLQLLGQSILFDSTFCESSTRISSKKSSSVTRINNFAICNLGAKVSGQIHLTRRHPNRPREEWIESVYIGISRLNQYANAT